MIAIHQENAGVDAARNNAINNAEGKYIFNTMNIPTDEANPDETPVWFAKAEKDLGVDADALLEQGGSYKIDETGIEQTETVTESAQ